MEQRIKEIVHDRLRARNTTCVDVEFSQPDDWTARVTVVCADGSRFDVDSSFFDVLDEAGMLPLPLPDRLN
jgi:hypothetical protein